MEYGYVRVSSREQNVDRQLDALHSMGLDTKQIYMFNSHASAINACCGIWFKIWK